MRVSLNHLRQYCSRLPADPVAVRHLFDDVGIEVKRLDEEAGDAVLSLELLANRGDHRCYAGIARELVARLGGPLQLPQAVELQTGNAGLPIRLETDLCLLYTATPIEIALGGAAFPYAVLAPLFAAGLQHVSPQVDATNLVNLELGQPTHCFDAATIAGGVAVRTSREGEKAWPLFQPGPIPLPPGTLVIADDEKIIAIAGVIGCEESKVTERTRKALLESAAFDPVAVRKGSRGIGIQTDASARFERGSDPSLALKGAGRVVYLLETHAGCRRLGPTAVVGDWRDPKRTISIDLERLGSFFGRPFSPEECRQKLEPYEFSVAATDGPRRLQVTVPPHRLWDVANPEDVYEELARCVGYNELPESLPPASMGVQPSSVERTKERVEELLLGLDFYEVMTDGFYSRKVREDLCLDEKHPLWRHVETENALDSALRPAQEQLPGAGACGGGREPALRHGDGQSLRVGTHVPPQSSCRERGLRRAADALADRVRECSGSDVAEKARPVDIWFLEGIVEELAVELRLPIRVGDANPDHPVGLCLHPHRQSTILLGEKTVGVLGEVDGRILRSFGIKRVRPYYWELETDVLHLEEKVGDYRLPSPRPPSVRMLAFTLSHKMQAGEVARCLSANGPDWLQRVSIVDLYAHESAGSPSGPSPTRWSTETTKLNIRLKN